MLSLVPSSLMELSVDCDVQGPTEGIDSFLSCVARLQHLTRLELEVGSTGSDWPTVGHAYSALTASSKLAQLDIVVTGLPMGIWPYVFSGAHKLPHLTYLDLRDSDYDDADAFAFSPRWGAADLASLVSCCPSLCCIGTLSLQPGLHVSELHKLTALTRVDVWCYSDNAFAVVDSVRGLAAVT